MCWHLGGSQTDIANLKAKDIDFANRTIAYTRQKKGSLAMIHFGDEIEMVLRRLPSAGPLFPYLRSVRCGDRAAAATAARRRRLLPQQDLRGATVDDRREGERQRALRDPPGRDG